jgi:FemAB-related protein (PEP-CTERM system-associated)
MLPSSKMMCNISPFDGTRQEWDEFVRECNGWTHFHLHGWRTVIEEVFGHECIYLAAREPEGRLAGVLPLVRVRSLVFGHYLVSMPFLNYGGPLGSDAAVRGLVDHAVELADESDADLLELRSRAPLAVDLVPSHRKLTVLLSVPAGDPESLWKRLAAKTRSQVRRPRREGVSVSFGFDQLRPFYAVFARHMRDLGTPVLPQRFFERIAEAFPDDVWFGCAYLRGKPIAGGCGLEWEREFELTWASALRRHSRIAANMLLYWSFMKRAAEEELQCFNLGRCSPSSGTHRFKQQWGGDDEKLWWYQHSAGKTVATPSPDDGVYAVGPRLWRHLPMWAANALGPRIVRCIP